MKWKQCEMHLKLGSVMTVINVIINYWTQNDKYKSFIKNGELKTINGH